MVGVDVSSNFLFQKVIDLFLAKDTGSPSVPADIGYLSTSSHKTSLIGLLAKLSGEFAPTIDI